MARNNLNGERLLSQSTYTISEEKNKITVIRNISSVVCSFQINLSLVGR